MKSKTLAEKAAWDYLNGLPESEKFELVIINPVLILGPSELVMPRDPNEQTITVCVTLIDTF